MSPDPEALRIRAMQAYQHDPVLHAKAYLAADLALDGRNAAPGVVDAARMAAAVALTLTDTDLWTPTETFSFDEVLARFGLSRDDLPAEEAGE